MNGTCAPPKLPRYPAAAEALRTRSATLPITRTGAMLFFQLMSRRYETGSTILTSHKSFDEWGEIFGDEVMAGALIDRLVHHCHIVNLRRNSYRMRQHAELYGVLHRRGQVPDPAPLKRRPRAREATTP